MKFYSNYSYFIFFYFLLIFSALSYVNLKIQVKVKLESSNEVSSHILLESKSNKEIQIQNTNSDSYTIDAMKKIFNNLFSTEKNQNNKDNFSNLFNIPNFSSNEESNFKINGNVTLNVLENNLNPVIENKKEDNFDSFNEDVDLQKNTNANNIVQGIKIGNKSKLADNIFADVKKFKIFGKENFQSKENNSILIEDFDNEKLEAKDINTLHGVNNSPTVRNVDDFEAEIKKSKINRQKLNPKVLNDVTIHNHYHVNDKSTNLVKPKNPNIFNLRRKQKKNILEEKSTIIKKPNFDEQLKQNLSYAPKLKENYKPLTPSANNFIKTKESIKTQSNFKTIDLNKLKDPHNLNVPEQSNVLAKPQINNDLKISDNHNSDNNVSVKNLKEITNNNKNKIKSYYQYNKTNHLIIPVDLNNSQLKKKWTMGDTKDFNDYDYRKTIDYILNN
jgi:hypothetical protein